MTDELNLGQHKALDRAIVSAAKDIKVLSRLSWPAGKMEQFLAGWRRGNPALPDVTYPPADDLADAVRVLSDTVQALERLDDPIANYLRATAGSYLTLCDLLAKAGTPAMVEASRSLYGFPGDPLSDGRVNNLQAARHFLEQSAQYYQATHLHEADYCVSAAIIKEDLERRLADVFPPDTVQVVIDPGLASKAAAGATRIRLRGDTCFSGYDLEQLLQHEAFVHSLTALNGRAQKSFKCFGLGAPRTTGP